jgi:hypothetical protein
MRCAFTRDEPHRFTAHRARLQEWRVYARGAAPVYRASCVNAQLLDTLVAHIFQGMNKQLLLPSLT